MNEFDQTPLERRKEQKEVLKWGAGCSTLIGVIIILSFLCNTKHIYYIDQISFKNT